MVVCGGVTCYSEGEREAALSAVLQVRVHTGSAVSCAIAWKGFVCGNKALCLVTEMLGVNIAQQLENVFSSCMYAKMARKVSSISLIAKSARGIPEVWTFDILHLLFKRVGV
eukprot:1156580-Pelagomonas_calceolata.AAC.4